MAELINFPVINSLDFAVFDEKQYVTLRDLTFGDITVPKGFIFDGISVPWGVMWMFTHNELKRGIRAACFHDFMCEPENRGRYKRKEATSILLKLWKKAGLGNRWYTSWKPYVVYIAVELYQMRQGGWK